MPSESSQGTALFAPVAKFKSVMSAMENVRGAKQKTTSCVEVLSGVTTTFFSCCAWHCLAWCCVCGSENIADLCKLFQSCM